MKDERNVSLVRLYTGSRCEAAILKTLLEDYGIQSFEKDDTGGTFSDLSSIPGLYNSISVIVSQIDSKTAREVVTQFEKNLTSNNSIEI